MAQTTLPNHFFPLWVAVQQLGICYIASHLLKDILNVFPFFSLETEGSNNTEIGELFIVISDLCGVNDRIAKSDWPPCYMSVNTGLPSGPQCICQKEGGQSFRSAHE